ncbi:hypothetical protein [Ichthyenterobacterium magnum]|uniref:Surface antigen-like protein n=1 Tax=Ichthyenterobacterium magnum TaxID=1230530 RepID=A0A420DXW5_9FLAO|nr:hypothetical protein [Ichthyenterobacterium magnum]RKE99047.1 hypothetical protein BXY80_1148 [Ichthyenterobacterium magnum]
MQKCFLVVVIFLSTFVANSQEDIVFYEASTEKKDSLKKKQFIKQLGNGFLPTKFLNFDLRYLIKFNQYEGIRTGIGGVTNDAFSKKYRINSYLVYGFKDHRFKYRIGGGFRVSSKTNTWINLSYTDDLYETGSSKFLTDKRFFQFFEPRLLNIDLFHKHITKAINIEHQLSNNLLTETELSISKIDPTYDYTFALKDKNFSNFDLSIAKLALQWNPFTTYTIDNNKKLVEQEGFPKFTLQVTQSFKNLLKGDFNFFKADFRTLYKLNYNKNSFTEATLTAGIATGNTPLTHLYHAYPNNITKETILQRFSVAGINSFETMYFNEFFSDRFTTLQLKHYIKPFKISKRFNPQLVLISRHALGDMHDIERHQNIEFGTLTKGYSEAGFELNKILFGFGLSFAYRYGAYHLPKEEDNVALKFTFNLSL